MAHNIPCYSVDYSYMTTYRDVERLFTTIIPIITVMIITSMRNPPTPAAMYASLLPADSSLLSEGAKLELLYETNIMYRLLLTFGKMICYNYILATYITKK